MEEYKRYKKDFSNLGLVYIIGTVIILAVQTLLELLILKIKPQLLEDINIMLIFSSITTYFVCMPIIYLMAKKLPAKVPDKHAMGAGKFVVAVIMSFALIYCSNILGTIITTVIGVIKGSPVDTNAASMMAMNGNMFITFVSMVIIAPIVEELMFRKVIVDRVCKYGQGVAVVVSGLMFGLFHGNLSQFVYAFTLGMFLAFIYVRTGNIKITIAMHMLINFMGGIVSVLIYKMLFNSGIYDMVSGDYDPLAFTDYLMGPEGGTALIIILVMMIYVMLVFGLMIAGTILFIVFRKKFTLNKGEIVLEKGKRFSTIIMNPGMIIYCLFWIAMIIYQILQ